MKTKGSNTKDNPTNTNISVRNVFNAHQNQTSKTNSSSRQKSNSETNEKYKPIFSTVADSFKQNVDSLSNWASNNKLKIALSTISIMYLGTFYRIIVLWNAIKNNECWSLWKSSLNFEMFLSIPQKQLTEELISDINLKNSNPKNPTDFINPLVLFISQTDNELQNLKDFIAIATMMKNLNLERIFFISEVEISKVQERVQRLTYIRNLFSTWMSDYRKQQLLNPKG